MKQRFCLLWIALGLWVAGGARADSRESGTPRIVFAETVYDFGSVEQGEPVGHLFRFTNEGEGDLHIEQVQTSCGCTATVVSSKVIPPGGEGQISAVLDTSHLFGEKARTVTVYTNDPTQPVVTLTLQGTIVTEVAAVPPQLYLGRIRKGNSVSREVKVLYDARKDLAITEIKNHHPFIQVRVEDLEEGEKKGKKLWVTLDQGVSLGSLNDEITITTTSSKNPKLVIPVFGSVEGDLLVRPPQVSFGMVPRGEARVREVRIKNRGPQKVRILRVEPSVGYIAAKVSPLREGAEYLLTVRLKEAPARGRIQGEVRVYTDHPREKEISVPLYGVVARARQANL